MGSAASVIDIDQLQGLTWEEAENYLSKETNHGKCIGVTCLPYQGRKEGVYLVCSYPHSLSTYHDVGSVRQSPTTTVQPAENT